MRWRGLLRYLTGAVVAAVLLYRAQNVSAQPGPGLPLGDSPSPRYNVHQWTSANGLPASTIQCLLQTHDGYLWIGTRAGLVRFNGEEFRTFPEINCRCLAEDSQGILWIGSSQELLQWDGVEVKSYQLPHPNHPHPLQPVLSVCACRAGGVWVGWELELWRAERDKRWKVTNVIGKGFPEALCESLAGQLYVAGNEGVCILKPTDAPEPTGLPLSYPLHGARCVLQDTEGGLWFGGDDTKLHHLKEGVLKVYPENVGNLVSLTQDARGTIWLGTRFGLWVLRDQHIVRPLDFDGAALGVVNCLLTDCEGNLWAGTEDNGLFCLKAKPFAVYTVRDGLISDDIWSLVQSHDGSLWIGTKHGISHLREGKFENYLAVLRAAKVDEHPNEIDVIIEDRSGTVWCGGISGFFRFTKDGLVLDEGAWKLGIQVPSSAHLGADGELLVTYSNFLCEFQKGHWRFHPATDLLSEQHAFFVGALEGRADDLWLGSFSHGLYHIQNGKYTRLTQKDGLTSNLAGPVMADPDGTIWIVSDKGLNRLKNGRITRYTMAEGLAEDIVLNVLEDDQGWFWLNGHRGIHRVRRQDLDDLAAGKRASLDCVTYGLEDGLLSVEGNGGTLPNSCKTTDGRLWFPTTKGLAVIDPIDTKLDALPAPVVVESLQADGRMIYENSPRNLAELVPVNVMAAPSGSRTASGRIPAPGEVRLRPGRAGSLLFKFAANTLVRSKQVRFRCRLEGREPQWMDLGTQASASFNDLPPGHYRFQVTACNSHGIWNPSGAALAFYIAPFFYQTWLFYSLCAGTAGLMAAAFLTYRLRLQRRILMLERDNALQRERVRIAEDIHDELGARLTQLGLVCGEPSLVGKPASAAGARQLAQAGDLVRDLLRSLDEIVWAVAPANDRLEPFASYVASYAQDFLSHTPVALRLDLPLNLPDLELRAEARHNLLMALKEGLANVVKHSGASTLHLKLWIDAGELRLKLADDGCGFDLNRPRANRNGLGHLRERLKTLGGQAEIRSIAGQGTEVELSIPLQVPSASGG